MRPDGMNGRIWILREMLAKDADMREAADVRIVAAAAGRFPSPRIACEKMAVILLDVGVAMSSRRQHEVDVASQVII